MLEIYICYARTYCEYGHRLNSYLSSFYYESQKMEEEYYSVPSTNDIQLCDKSRE